MRGFIAAIVVGFLILAPTYLYVYNQGAIDGVARYQRSERFKKTLFSMYRFGLMDGCTDDRICDKYGFGNAEEGGHR